MAGEPAPGPPVDVEVRRSRRRRRTVTAYRDGDRVVVLIPARLTRAQEREWVQRMVARLSAQDRRRRPGDSELMTRAQELSRRYLGGAPQPVSVTWVANQNSRWGSCTPADRTIRLSTRLQGMPGWVIDYVLLHELAHLVEEGHGARFWELLQAYPRTERARGYLDGFAAARDLRIGEDDPDLEHDFDPDIETEDVGDPDIETEDVGGEDIDDGVDADSLDVDGLDVDVDAGGAPGCGPHAGGPPAEPGRELEVGQGRLDLFGDTLDPVADR
ncbi:MAG TPA: M48 family metallopeptidase [Kineosporiaceae bacterium]|nr:M48 family metallopeptidase [Kineosporiaceae bacterium]